MILNEAGFSGGGAVRTDFDVSEIGSGNKIYGLYMVVNHAGCSIGTKKNLQL